MWNSISALGWCIMFAQVVGIPDEFAEKASAHFEGRPINPRQQLLQGIKYLGYGPPLQPREKSNLTKESQDHCKSF